MAKQLPKKLDLGMSNRGGRTSFYARNIMEHGDWATVGCIVGEVADNAEILISPYKEFNTPEYVEQMKQHLLAINPTLVFANDQKGGAFVSAEKVIEVASKNYKLMSFEIEQIKINPETLHELYLSAKPKKLYSVPSNYNYQSANSQYPFIQAFSAITEIIHG